MSNIQYPVNKIDGLRAKIKSFVISVINFSKNIPKDEVGRIFINQLLRSTTSIGANFEESVEAESNNDVIHKMSIVKKEAKETKYWLDLIQDCFPNLKTKAAIHISEADALIRIFASIISKRRSH